MRTTSEDPKVYQNRMRRVAHRQGYVLTKARGRELYLLERVRTATGFSGSFQSFGSLYEVEEFLRRQRERIAEFQAEDA